MTKKEFVALMKMRNIEDAETTYDTIMGIIEETLLKGEEVSLNGVGKLKIKDKPAHVGRNPKTGESVPVPAKKVIKFSVAKSLKEAVK